MQSYNQHSVRLGDRIRKRTNVSICYGRGSGFVGSWKGSYTRTVTDRTPACYFEWVREWVSEWVKERKNEWMNEWMEVLRPVDIMTSSGREHTVVTYSVRWWMKLGGNLPPCHDVLLFSISGMGYVICPVAPTRLDIPRLLITQSWTTGRKVKEICFQVSGGLNRRPVMSQINKITTTPPCPPPLLFRKCKKPTDGTMTPMHPHPRHSQVVGAGFFYRPTATSDESQRSWYISSDD